MIIKHNKDSIRASRDVVMAADEDEEEDEGLGGFSFDDEDDSMDETLEGIADDIEDMQEDVDELQEDDVSIEIDNNIEGHYIAECDKCKGIFISAMTETDQVVESIKGTCPLCDKESEQFIKWVIKKVD